MTEASYRRMMRRRKLERWLCRYLPMKRQTAVRLSRLLP